MNDIMKIVKALEDSNILLKGVTKTNKNVTKEQKGGFLSRLLGTLGASLLGHLLTGRGITKTGSGNEKGKGNKKGKEIVRAGSGKQWNFSYRLILKQILKYKNIIKMNQDLMVFFNK